MNKLKEIRSVEELKEFIYLHRDLLKKAALPVTVAAAVLFFWIFGMGHDRAIEERNVEGDEGRHAGIPDVVVKAMKALPARITRAAYLPKNCLRNQKIQ